METKNQELTIEIATNNLSAALSHPDLKLNKLEHISLDLSLNFLKEKANENEILKAKIIELENLTKID